jgi:2-methylcitrate dehydratase PrpD
MKETERLAGFVASLRFEDLPPEVVEMAKTGIRDALGVAMFASDLEWTRLVRGYVEDTGSTGGATIWGSNRRCAPAHAAMVNGTAVHGIEMDDRSTLLDIHNGAVTIPAAVALSEHLGRSGRDLIVAVVCGYEAAYRVARATLGGIWPRF